MTGQQDLPADARFQNRQVGPCPAGEPTDAHHYALDRLCWHNYWAASPSERQRYLAVAENCRCEGCWSRW